MLLSEQRCVTLCRHEDAAETAYAVETTLRYSVRAPPTPTPSEESSPPTEISTDGRMLEHTAMACARSLHFVRTNRSSLKQPTQERGCPAPVAAARFATATSQPAAALLAM